MKKFLWIVCILLLASCASMTANEPLNILGEWRIEYIGERPVIDHSPATIAFEKGGKFGGNAGCNRYFGSFTLAGAELQIDKGIGSTRMMCAVEALMEQENRLFQVLPMAATVSLDNGLLLITDNAGQQLLKAAPQDATLEIGCWAPFAAQFSP